MLNDSIVTFIFQCLNVAVIVGGATYLFKTRLFPLIKEQMAKIKIARNALRDQSQHLELEQQRVLYQGIEQHALSEKLKNALEVWRAKEYARLVAIAREQEAIQKQVAAKVKQQTIYVGERALYDAVVPRAIMHAEKTLRSEFDNSPGAQRYLQDLLKALK